MSNSANQAKGTIFQEWKNLQDQDSIKIHENKRELEKIEYKGQQKIRKAVEVRSFLIKRRVTSGFIDRQKIKPFGIGNSEDEVRQNVNLTSIQRENVWHPYYEIKVEEEDFKEKIQAKQKEKKEQEGNLEIKELEKKIQALEEKERQEQQDQFELSQGGPKKKLFDFAAIQRQKKQDEIQEMSIPQEDPYTVKLKNLSSDITEEDIERVMARFGNVIKTKIPKEELKNGRFRSYGFAYVSFDTIESAQLALAEKEVNVEYATLDIEVALKKVMQPRDQVKLPSEFDQLKRNKV
ncbi:nucleic acid-binding protein [Stylonychia lemnae]|uniref:Nucleic acid-binding protein n=1 Tax=Stylonychia lemnae TaxID=5949 RepID=A0A077ZUE1_STYLE|nr:nucleic acid-binding protein [Stylonychia lemnae]|eukprot:CDW73487.1 nucleic acid-binding protein [Stylonychia lemnae]